MKATKISIEKYNIDTALEVFNNNQFQLILGGAVRAREIANARNRELRDEPNKRYDTGPVVQAIIEIAEGTLGVELLTKAVTKQN